MLYAGCLLCWERTRRNYSDEKWVHRAGGDEKEGCNRSEREVEADVIFCFRQLGLELGALSVLDKRSTQSYIPSTRLVCS